MRLSSVLFCQRTSSPSLDWGAQGEVTEKGWLEVAGLARWAGMDVRLLFSLDCNVHRGSQQTQGEQR